MKHQNFTLKKTTGRLFLLTLGLFLLTSLRGVAQCLPASILYDLESSSISPNDFPTISIGQSTTVTAFIFNNGPCAIPAGEANAQVSVNATYFSLDGSTIPLLPPPGFQNICGATPWSFLGSTVIAGQHVLSFRKNGGPIPVGGAFCGFTFRIKGLNVTPPPPIPPPDITLVTSINVATATGVDFNLTNQTATAQLGVAGTILPVVLSDFSGIANSCNGVLSWKTATEDNVDRFEIEYSVIGTQFTTVGTVDAKNATSGSDYRFANAQGTSKGFYRLKIIDNDGQFSYSRTISISTVCNGKKTISIYPNPITAKQNLTVIASGYEGSMKGELVAVSGQVIRTYTLKNGTNTLPVENLAQSTYLLRVTDASGQAESFRVMVIK